ncbi:MAG: transglycosylase SLT domain-containing protein [Patescibacteria group bacterium]
MSSPRPLLSFFFVGCAAFFLAPAMPAFAEDAPLILQMADGRYYHPASGIIATDKHALLTKIGLGQTVVQEVVPIPEKPLILKMADGRYYHPGSGIIATNEAALLARIGWSGSVGAIVGEDTRNLTPILLAVYRAQDELRARISAQGKNVRYPMAAVGQDAPRNVTIAVWNQQTDQISYVEGVKSGRDLEIEGGSPVRISVRLTNWINSDYATDDPNHIVVAVRYPIYHEIKNGTVVTRYDVEEAVYTPYNKTLHQADIIVEGERVLDETIEKAAQELKNRGVGSRALSGKNVTDTVAHDLIKALVVIEHVGSAEARGNPGTAAGKVFATIGLNPRQAYNYSGSSAGAFGLAQFIPSTYNRLVTRSELGLIPDFQAGMRDHQNAMKASYAYLDAVLGELPATAKDLPADNVKLFEYLAAAYNGGSSKVKTAIQIWDDQISGELQSHEILTRSRLHSETIDYVKKLRAVLPVILGGETPPALKPASST